MSKKRKKKNPEMDPKTRKESFRGNVPNREDSTGDRRRVRGGAGMDRGARRTAGDARKQLDDNPGCNDPRWYSYNPQIVADYASFPYGVAVGTPYNLGDNDSDAYSIPGVMNVRFIPCVGWADNENAPINIAMRQIYSYVRKANSGATNYEAADLLKYIVCLDSAYMYLAWMRRLYGIARDYSQVNRYYPEALMKTMGVDPDSIVSNLADFRGFINVYASKISSMALPATMPYMLRHTWMVSNLYVDSNQEKAQTYFYDPDAYYIYTEGTGSQSQSSVVLNLPPTRMSEIDDSYSVSPQGVNAASLQDIKDFGNSIINPLLASQANNIMSGDILKAFEGNVVKAIGVTDDYQVLPIYNEEVLSQIMNATPMGAVNLLSCTLIEETAINQGWIKSTPGGTPWHFPVQYYSSSAATNQLLTAYKNAAADALKQSNTNGGNIDLPFSANRYITFNKGHITADDTMVATRLTNTYSNLAAFSLNVNDGGEYAVWGGIRGNIETAGSEICTFITMGQFVRSSGLTNLVLVDLNVGAVTMSNIVSNVGSNISLVNTLVNTIRNMTYRLTLVEAFDWHPQILPTWVFYLNGTVTVDGDTYDVPQVGGITVREPSGIFADMGNYTVLTRDNLVNLAQVALLSEFYIPTVGTMSIGLA